MKTKICFVCGTPHSRRGSLRCAPCAYKHKHDQTKRRFDSSKIKKDMLTRYEIYYWKSRKKYGGTGRMGYWFHKKEAEKMCARLAKNNVGYKFKVRKI